jgi:uncharacterized DUF497 family protein
MNTWDEAKRQVTLLERGLDFADAERVFEGRRFYTRSDDRRDYREARFITVGYLFERFVVVVWTDRTFASTPMSSPIFARAVRVGSRRSMRRCGRSPGFERSR